MVILRSPYHLALILILAASATIYGQTAPITIRVTNSDDDNCNDIACSINREDHSGFTLALPAVAAGATIRLGPVDATVDPNSDTTVQLRWWDPDFGQYHYSDPLRLHTSQQPPTEFAFNIPPSSGRRILIVAPHPDDETLAHAGVIYHALHGNHLAHARVRVAIVTSGDAYTSAVSNYYYGDTIHTPTAADFRNSALVRHGESLNAMSRLGLIASDDVLFLGYPDQGLRSLYTNNYDTANAWTSSYTQRNEKYDPDAFRRDASPESIRYAGTNVLQDLVAILSSFGPTEVYVPDLRDSHVDHDYTYLFLAEALRTTGTRSTTIYREIIHAQQQSSTYWPNPAWDGVRENRCTPTQGFDTPMGMPVPDAVFDFSAMSMDSPMRRSNPATNLKRLAIDAYQSQIGWYNNSGVLMPSTAIDSKGYLISFAKSNELCWSGGHDGPDGNDWPTSPAVQAFEQSASGQLSRQYSQAPLQQDIRDVWRLPVSQPGRMRFRMDITGSDMGLRLYDSDGITLLATFQQPGLTEPFDHVFCKAGTYYLDVFIAGPGTGGIYSLYDKTILPTPGDYDQDCDVDLYDFALMQACALGPAIPYGNPPVRPECTLTVDATGYLPADYDRDGDLDHVDFGFLQRCFSGPGRPPKPDCAD